MEEKKEISKKEFAAYTGYALGIFLLLVGAIIPNLGESIWLTIVGGILLVGSHVSYEAMVTRKVVLAVAKKTEAEAEETAG